MPAYNSYFPVGYQPYTYPQQTQAQQNSGIIWVQGEAGAKAYPVVAGTSILLLDSENECFYIKSTDTSGMPMPLRTFTYQEKVQQSLPNHQNFNAITVQPEHTNSFNPNDYVTHDEFNELKTKIDSLVMANKPMNRKEKSNG